MFGLDNYYGYHAWGGALNGGNLGVDFFFVLSGFIICYAHWNDVGQPPRLLRRRVLRIYPIYWVAFVILLLPLYFMHSRFDEFIRSPLYLVRQFLLLPTGDGFVEVNWTLQHEVMFYAMFGVLVLNRAAGLVGLGLWFLASGMVAAFFVRNHELAHPRAVLALGCAGFVACLYAGGLGFGNLAVPGAPNLTLVVGVAAAMIIASLVELERSHGWRAPASMRSIWRRSCRCRRSCFALVAWRSLRGSCSTRPSNDRSSCGSAVARRSLA